MLKQIIILKQAIIVASFALSGAGIILLGHLSANPLAFTHPVGVLPISPPRHASIEAPASVATVGNMITLPEVWITGSRRGLKNHKVITARMDPCSNWSEVGAIFIDRAGATGSREVRTLCAKFNGEP